MNILSTKIVLTRKPHRCWGCWKTFESGTSMTRSAGTDAGAIHNRYTCKDCQTWINENTGDWSPSDWESTMPGSIGYWKNGSWHPQN